MHARAGFTLIEVIVTMALFAAIFALGLLMSFQSFRSADFRSERDTMVGVLMNARSRAMANIKQSPWGVHYDPSGHTYTIFRFRGVVYAAGAPDSLTTEGRPDATLSNWHDIIFTQLSGTTSPLMIAISGSGYGASVAVNYEGTIIW